MGRGETDSVRWKEATTDRVSERSPRAHLHATHLVDGGGRRASGWAPLGGGRRASGRIIHPRGGRLRDGRRILRPRRASLRDGSFFSRSARFGVISNYITANTMTSSVYYFKIWLLLYAIVTADEASFHR
jgi:hypothetical protein